MISSDSLGMMMKMQRTLDEKFDRFPPLDDGSAVSQYIRDTVLCATDELHELLHEVHWKPWKNPEGIKDRGRYVEELTDVLHFVLGLYLVAEVTPEELYESYVMKNHENLWRRYQDSYMNS